MADSENAWRMAAKYVNTGNALQRQNSLTEAIESYGKAIGLEPLLAEGWYNLGNALRSDDQIEARIVAYKVALRINPNLGEALHNLANALYDAGRVEEAIAAYQHATELLRGTAAPWCALGETLLDTHSAKAAVEAFRRAVEIDSGCERAHRGLGRALWGIDSFEEGMFELQVAVELDPDSRTANIALGDANREMGDFREAEACYRRAIACEPQDVDGRARLASLLGGRLPEDDLARLKSSLDQDIAARREATGRYALAHVLDAHGHCEQAAEQAERANSLAKAHQEARGAGYDAVGYRRFVTAMIQACDRNYFQRVASYGARGRNLIFVMGLPRSGTTLVERILAAHPRVRSVGEAAWAPEDFEWLVADVSTATPTEIRQALALDRLRTMDRVSAESIARRRLSSLEDCMEGDLRIVNKLPNNYLYFALLNALFPGATFIHCRRDLRDIAVSCWTNDFNRLPWTCDLKDLALHIGEYVRLMAHWRTSDGKEWLDVDYEAVVTDPGGLARRLVRWCELEWDPKCLHFQKTPGPIRTVSAIQVRRPVYRGSVGRWRRYEKSLSPLFLELGEMTTARMPGP
jgi:tetratricopeptide (TPR) repeat protein